MWHILIVPDPTIQVVVLIWEIPDPTLPASSDDTDTTFWHRINASSSLKSRISLFDFPFLPLLCYSFSYVSLSPYRCCVVDVGTSLPLCSVLTVIESDLWPFWLYGIPYMVRLWPSNLQLLSDSIGWKAPCALQQSATSQNQSQRSRLVEMRQ